MKKDQVFQTPKQLETMITTEMMAELKNEGLIDESETNMSFAEVLNKMEEKDLAENNQVKPQISLEEFSKLTIPNISLFVPEGVKIDVFEVTVKNKEGEEKSHYDPIVMFYFDIEKQQRQISFLTNLRNTDPREAAFDCAKEVMVLFNVCETSTIYDANGTVKEVFSLKDYFVEKVKPADDTKD